MPPIYRWHKLCNKDLLSKRYKACDQTSRTSTCTSTCSSKAEGGGADITTNTVGRNDDGERWMDGERRINIETKKVSRERFAVSHLRLAIAAILFI